MKRSDFIKKSLLAGTVISTSSFALISSCSPEDNSFKLPQLTYAYDALEPIIDKKTMEIHHSKHHQGYVNKLNKALETVDTKNSTLSTIVKNISSYSTAVRNNAGGHYNHSLFWTSLSPNKNTTPSNALANAIAKQFGSLKALKTQLTTAGKKRFGSGWAWLSVGSDGHLFISSTPNQDNPLMDVAEQQGLPILGIDVWEHAYYLNYQNKRGDYLSAICDIIDWEEISKRYTEAV